MAEQWDGRGCRVIRLPYLWSAYMAVGGLEVRCATRRRSGDDRASWLASRVLLAQALGFTLLGVALGRWFRNPASGGVPMLFAILHIWLAKWIANPTPAAA